MSYLPRMSKTYKEPQEVTLEEPEESTTNTLKPASSLLNEKTHNPLMVLKHYRYLPHPLPVLPGPSVLEEVMENELYREASRMKRSATKMENIAKASEITLENSSIEPSQSTLDEDKSKSEITEKVKRAQSKKNIKRSKSNLSKKKSSKTIKKENTFVTPVNMCVIQTRKPFTAAHNDKKSRDMESSELFTKGGVDSLKQEKSSLPVANEDLDTKDQILVSKLMSEDTSPEMKAKQFTNRSAQCTIFGNPTKLFVIPPVVNSLLRALAFLLLEINKEEVFSSSAGEKKTLMTQVQLILGDLCNQKVEKLFGFETTFSDFKRLEKIFGELKRYVKDVYGDKNEYTDRMEDFKRAFIELKKKEMELASLAEKVQENKEKQMEIVFKESDFKNPEITLQNRRLESEQLLAEVEFSCIELRNCQKTLAELDWDIRNLQEQISSLKKSAGTKSRTEVLGKKNSIHKFPSETLAKGIKNKESESSHKKKT